MTSDQQAQIEQIVSHGRAMLTDIKAARTRKDNYDLEMAEEYLELVIGHFVAGIGATDDVSLS